MADIWTLPAAPYLWATNPGTRTTPTVGRQATGWIAGEPVSASQANDLWGTSLDWIALLSEIAPADGTLTAQVIEVYDLAGPPVLAATISVGATTPSARITVGSTNLELREKGLIGPCAIEDADGVWFGYRTGAALRINHDFSPQQRGYTTLMETLAAIPCVMVFGTPDIALYNGDAVTAQRALFRSQIEIPAHSSQTARFPVLKNLSATFTGAAVDLQIRVIEITRATGAETVVATITSAAPSSTFGGGYTTTPTTKSYAMEIRSAAALATGALTTDYFRNLILQIDWYSLNPSP